MTSKRSMKAEKRSYSSGNNTDWLSVEQIRKLLKNVELEK